MVRESDYLTFDEALRQLVDEKTPLSSPVLFALSGSNTTEMQFFRRQWPGIPLQRRRQVMSQLVESAEANFELDFNALFHVGLEDPDAAVRTAAIEGLWEDEEITLIKPLVHVLRQDQAAAARAAAASSLGRFALMAELEELDERHAELVRDALLETIDKADEPIEVRRRAVESVAYLAEDCVRDIIACAYRDPDESMRISAVFAMGRSVDPAWSSTVLDELSNANPAMRYEAARACGELEVEDAVPMLIKLAADADREVQAAAIAALGEIGGKQARHALERFVRSEAEVVRLLAEDALAELELGKEHMDLLVYDPAEPHEDDDEAYDEDLDPED
jgi:HEAT repeat protein